MRSKHPEGLRRLGLFSKASRRAAPDHFRSLRSEVRLRKSLFTLACSLSVIKGIAECLKRNKAATNIHKS